MKENKLLWFFVLRMVSVSIPLIILDAHMIVILLVNLLVFLPQLVAPIVSMESALAVFSFSDLLYHLLLRPCLYVAALVVSVQGPQDFIAIAFYILAGVQAFNIIKSFLGYIISLVSSFKK